MSWDGIYRKKSHKKIVTEHGQKRPLCSAAKRIGAVYASSDDAVGCFACLKKMGVIK